MVTVSDFTLQGCSIIKKERISDHVGKLWVAPLLSGHGSWETNFSLTMWSTME